MNPIKLSKATFVKIEAIRQPKAKLQDIIQITSHVLVKETKGFGMNLFMN